MYPAEESALDLHEDNCGVVWLSQLACTNNTIVGNSFVNCGRPLCIFGQGNFIGQNNYSNNVADNAICKGNMIVDQDASSLDTATILATPDLLINSSTTSFQSYVPGVAQIRQIGNGAGTIGARVATTSASISQQFSFSSVNGVYASQFSIVIGYSASTLPGCTLSIYETGAGGSISTTPLTVITFTAPQTVDILTDDPFPIAIAIDLSANVYEFVVATPGGQLLNCAYGTVTVASGNSNAPGNKTEWYYYTTYQAYTATTCLQVGELGNNIGQANVTGILSANQNALYSDFNGNTTLSGYLLSTTVHCAVTTGGFAAGPNGDFGPEVFSTSGSIFSPGNVIYISGANTASNDGYYQVQEFVSPHHLYLCGISGNAPTVQIVQTQVTNDSTVAGHITLVTFSPVLQCSTAAQLALPSLPTYANDAAADADPNLPANGLYLVTGSRGVLRKTVGAPGVQVQLYNATGTFPNPVPASGEAVVVVSDVTSSSGIAPATSDVIFISTMDALPPGLNVGGAYCSAAGQITFKVLNVKTTAYIGAASYSLWFQGITQ